MKLTLRAKLDLAVAALSAIQDDCATAHDIITEANPAITHQASKGLTLAAATVGSSHSVAKLVLEVIGDDE